MNKKAFEKWLKENDWIIYWAEETDKLWQWIERYGIEQRVDEIERLLRPAKSEIQDTIRARVAELNKELKDE